MMMTQNDLFESLIAKMRMDGSYTWLPLYVHLEDTYEVAMLLWEHWLSDGVKKRLAEACGGMRFAKMILGLVALLHDAGKATPDFVTKILERLRIHDQSLANEIENRINALLSRRMASLVKHIPHALMSQTVMQDAGLNADLASVLGAHHGESPDKFTVQGMDAEYENYHGFRTENWKILHGELLHWAMAKVGFQSAEEIPKVKRPALVLLTGLVIMADWIASNENWFPYISVDAYKPDISSFERAKLAWDKIRMPEPWHSDADALEDVSWLFDKDKFGFDMMNPMQRDVAETINRLADPGIVIIEAPMGGGKTEAALAAAELLAAKTDKSGIFFALPTQTTSNGIFPRLLRWADSLSKAAGEAHSIRLVHGAAYLNEDYRSLLEGKANIEEDDLKEDALKPTSGVSIKGWFEGNKKALLADFVVGTVDQLLMAALKRRHVMLRHIGIAGKVVIIDECHAYDQYMFVYLEQVLRWLRAYNVPVVILSATLPAQRRSSLMQAYMGTKAALPTELSNTMEYPLMTYSNGQDVMFTALSAVSAPCEVRLLPLNDEKMLDLIGDIAKRDGCLGIVVNTVKKAQQIMAELIARYPGKDIRLIHSRLVMEDRAVRERRLLDALGKDAAHRPKSCIVVGTQVLEQSLDIDFDVMVSELCPMDLLLQRIGRLHRHKRNRPEGMEDAVCYVLGADEAPSDGSVSVYGEYLLKMTQNALPNKLNLPRDIPLLVNKVYGEPKEAAPAPELVKTCEEYKNGQTEQKRKARAFLLGKPESESKTATLIGWNSMGDSRDEKDAEAAVRDTDASLEVIALWKDVLGKLRYLADDGYVPCCPDRKAAARIAAQRLRLPTALCRAPYGSKKFVSEKVITELEQRTLQSVPDWQDIPLLKEELLLLFDENKRTTLGSWDIGYDAVQGLIYEKEGKDDGSKV